LKSSVDSKVLIDDITSSIVIVFSESDAILDKLCLGFARVTGSFITWTRDDFNIIRIPLQFFFTYPHRC